MFPLFTVDLPYVVVIHPSSCSAQTLLLFFNLFSFLNSHSNFLILLRIASNFLYFLFQSLPHGLPIFALKVSTHYSGFLHVWYSDVWFFNMYPLGFNLKLFIITLCLHSPQLVASLLHWVCSNYSGFLDLIQATATTFVVKTYSITSSWNVYIQIQIVCQSRSQIMRTIHSKCHTRKQA